MELVPVLVGLETSDSSTSQFCNMTHDSGDSFVLCLLCCCLSKDLFLNFLFLSPVGAVTHGYTCETYSTFIENPILVVLWSNGTARYCTTIQSTTGRGLCLCPQTAAAQPSITQHCDCFCRHAWDNQQLTARLGIRIPFLQESKTTFQISSITFFISTINILHICNRIVPIHPISDKPAVSFISFYISNAC